MDYKFFYFRLRRSMQKFDANFIGSWQKESAIQIMAGGVPEFSSNNKTLNALLLQMAIQYHRADLVELILQKLKAAFKMIDNYVQGNILRIAAIEGQLAFLQCFTNLNDSKNILLNGATFIYYAAQNGHLDMGKTLIRLRANVNTATSDINATPLFIAAQRGHLPMVELLLQNKADPNLLTKKGSSPLHVACSQGYLSIVKVLLENKAHIYSDDKEITPFYASAYFGHCEVARLLIKKSNLGYQTFQSDRKKILNNVKKIKNKTEIIKLVETANDNINFIVDLKTQEKRIQKSTYGTENQKVEKIQALQKLRNIFERNLYNSSEDDDQIRLWEEEFYQVVSKPRKLMEEMNIVEKMQQRFFHPRPQTQKLVDNVLGAFSPHPLQGRG